jgi:hypothetical protein
MNQFVLFIFLLSFVFQSACTSGRPAAEDVTANDRALALIDERNYEQAIQLLKLELEKNPANSETRILLASALAGKNGVVMTRFTQLARTLIEKNQTQPAANSKKWQGLEWQLKLARSAFEGIPTLRNGEAYQDLTTALQVLIESADSPGIHLFRAILRLVIFKYEITHPYKLEFHEGCMVDIKPLHAWFNKVTSNLQSLVADLLGGVKDQKSQDDLEKLYAKIMKARESIEDTFAMFDENGVTDAPKIIRKFYGACE